MNIFLKYSVLASYLILAACGDEHHHDHEGHDHGGHAHEAPHGGALVLLGEHGTGFHLEIILSKEGMLDLYVLDGEVEHFVRIAQGFGKPKHQHDGSGRRDHGRIHG